MVSTQGEFDSSSATAFFKSLRCWASQGYQTLGRLPPGLTFTGNRCAIFPSVALEETTSPGNPEAAASLLMLPPQCEAVVQRGLPYPLQGRSLLQQSRGPESARKGFVGGSGGEEGEEPPESQGAL